MGKSFLFLSIMLIACAAKGGDPSLCVCWNALHHVLGISTGSWIFGVDGWSHHFADAGWEHCFDALCPPKMVVGGKASESHHSCGLCFGHG